MDDQDLKQLFDSQDIPAPNDNRRKETLNLAQMEFEKNQKNHQGSSFFSRLISRQPNKEGSSMSFSQKKTIYGGLATACVALLVYTAYPLVQQNQQERSASQMKQVMEDYNQKQLNLAQKTGNSVIPEPIEVPKQSPMALANKPVAGMDIAQAPAMADKAMLMSERAASVPVAPVPTGGIAVSDAMIAPEPMPYQPQQQVGNDKFKHVDQNSIHQVASEPISTFSIDVDTSSYSFVRQSLDNGVLPQADAVRVEEMVNYFDYAYPHPTDKNEPFKSSVVVKDSPWHPGHKLVAIGIKGYEEQRTESPDSNLVFLIDTSGSMNEPKKLPLLKQSLSMLVDQLKPTDKVSIVAYAGSAGTVLAPTSASDKQAILTAIQNMQPGGSTAGAEGINLAYQLAESNFNKNAVNRVILATDGDFNVGITNPEELKSFIEHKRESGVYLSVLGFGTGNYNDELMQDLAQNGNGVAAYIDNLNEARKVLVQEAGAMLFPIAKDVKIQVEFNPKTVSEYRLVGYETRALATEDFNNDKVDAGDIGSGHAVTAIYEITPVGTAKSVDDSRYAAKTSSAPAVAERNDLEYGFLKIRYKLPSENESKLITTPISINNEKPTAYLKLDATLYSETDFAVAVAGFAQMLKGGKYTGSLTYDDIIKAADANKGKDPYGYRSEFVNMVYKAKTAAAMQPPVYNGNPQPPCCGNGPVYPVPAQ